MSRAPSTSPDAANASVPSPVPGPLTGIELLVRASATIISSFPNEDLAAVVHGTTTFAVDLFTRSHRRRAAS